jgi:GTP-binding protein
MSKLNAKFLSSFAKIETLPRDGKPEIAFIGRSNVGKSSLINALVERKGLAKTSSTPGKTQLLNYFDVNDQFYIVDMPGYGYAKVSRDKRQDWGKVSEDYFKKRKELKLVVLLIDSRHEGLANDISVVEWFSEKQIPFIVVLTKSDKVKQQDLAKHEKMLKQNVYTAQGIFKTSSEAGRGIRELRGFLLSVVAEKSAAETDH